MENQRSAIEQIHDSLVNGQRKQMVRQIDEQVLYDFWEKYANYLAELYYENGVAFSYFRDAVISYHRIKNR